MRPVRLTMQAFGPYPVREIIDFRDAVDAGLFGIYGKTGSGKSSIFSAITFALFGEPAKADQEATSLRSDHADAGMHTEVEFVFDMGGQRYVVLRRPDQMRPKQRGGGETRSAHEAFLFNATGLALDDIKEGNCGKIIAEKKVRDVDLAVSDLLGYGPSQFRQIVLLPQGRFEVFLSAKTKERLNILRELFDVSLYGSLMARLRTDAEETERYVREEREVCVRRLTAEGFESTDALGKGLSDAEAYHEALQASEKTVRVAFEVARTAVQEGEKIEAQFQTAESAQGTLATLQAGKASIDALAGRIVKAERASALRDTEVNVVDANTAIGEAKTKLDQAQKATTNAVGKQQVTSDLLKKETERAGEIDGLRSQIEEFARHQQTLEKTASVKEAVGKAHALEQAAAAKSGAAQNKLAGIQVKRRERSETLKTAHKSEGQRHEIAMRLAAVKTAIVSSEAFEKIEKGVLDANTAIASLASKHGAAKHAAEKALAILTEAERSLSIAQALHLASKLVDGEPCSVCGSAEHPSPATGATEHAGRDQAFRDAKAVWQKADEAAHAAEQVLVGAQSVLKERQDRLTGLDRPANSSAELKVSAEAERQALESLGPKIDLAELDAEIGRLDEEIGRLEIEREALRTDHARLVNATTSERARLDEMIAVVPEALRDSSILATAHDNASQKLTARRAAKEKAEATATAAREAALAAQKDQEAAQNALSLCQERQNKAIKTFQSRLAKAGLSEDAYHALKPCIETIDQDRAAVEDHRRKLNNAQDAANMATEAVQGQTRPDLAAMEARRLEAEQKLAESTEQRSGAGHRLGHLTKLRDNLSETFRKLDEAENTSGPLRNMAAAVNGDNMQKLDLETFAIGAMFDQVLEAANLRLGPMTCNRYRMERDLEGGGRGRRGLGIQVFDFYTGKPRPTATLSGGETFIAALALALGLADVVESASGKVRLDTIFIDEGFGSLDAEDGAGTLDKVLDVLNSLVSQNRAVGLISHVPLVQEAIPNGFYVRMHLTGSSVETRGVV